MNSIRRVFDQIIRVLQRPEVNGIQLRLLFHLFVWELAWATMNSFDPWEVNVVWLDQLSKIRARSSNACLMIIQTLGYRKSVYLTRKLENIYYMYKVYNTCSPMTVKIGQRIKPGRTFFQLILTTWSVSPSSLNSPWSHRPYGTL